ncbi:MAG: hypothetical protein M8467_19665 [Anaerolineae bacterium]|nr:hypothetical protein [Anaerolineae bacterium]
MRIVHIVTRFVSSLQLRLTLLTLLAVSAALGLTVHTCFHKPLQIERLLQALTQIHDGGLGRMLGHPARKKEE